VGVVGRRMGIRSFRIKKATRTRTFEKMANKNTYLFIKSTQAINDFNRQIYWSVGHKTS